VRWTRCCSSGCIGTRAPLSSRQIQGISIARRSVHFYALRHTFARAIEDAGAKASETQSRLGHSSLQTTETYLAGWPERRTLMPGGSPSCSAAPRGQVSPSPGAERLSAMWAELNERQRAYLRALYDCDQAEERARRQMAARGHWSRAQASEWRWVMYEPVSLPSALYSALRTAGLVDPGTGSTWAALRDRGLVRTPIPNGIFWRLATGAAWRDIPERYGPWQTISDRDIW